MSVISDYKLFNELKNGNNKSVINFLKNGGHKDPLEIMNNVGTDLSKSETYDSLIKATNDICEQLRNL